MLLPTSEGQRAGTAQPTWAERCDCCCWRIAWRMSRRWERRWGLRHERWPQPAAAGDRGGAARTPTARVQRRRSL